MNKKRIYVIPELLDSDNIIVDDGWGLQIYFSIKFILWTNLS